MDSWRGAPPSGENERNETVGKPPKRRFRRRATLAQRGMGPGCVPTEVGGPAGRLRAAGRAHGVHWDLDPLDPSAGSGPRAPRMWRLTSVRLVRDTSVDHSGRLAGRVGRPCAAHGIQALLSHHHRRACPRHSPCCHGRSQRIICTGCRRRPVDRHRHGRGLWEHLWGSQRHLGRWHNTGRHSVVSRGCSSAVCSRLCEPRTCQKSAVQDALGGCLPPSSCRHVWDGYRRAVCLHRRAGMSGTGTAAEPDTNSVLEVDKIAEVGFGMISGTRAGAVSVGTTSDGRVWLTAQDALQFACGGASDARAKQKLGGLMRSSLRPRVMCGIRDSSHKHMHTQYTHTQTHTRTRTHTHTHKYTHTPTPTQRSHPWPDLV